LSGFRGGLRYRHGERRDQQAGDAAAVHFRHRDPVAGDLDRVARRRQFAERREHVARDGLVGSLRQPDRGLLGELVQVEQAVHLDFALRQLGGGRLARVVLVPDVADELLDQVLEGDDARGAAVLVDHDRQVDALAAHLGKRGEHGLADRQELDRPDHLVDEGRLVGRGGAEQVPDVHEPDDVVVRALVDGQPRVGDARGDARGLADRRARGEELDLGARPQHLADLPLARVEDLADDAPLVDAQRLRAGHELAHFLFGHGLAALPGVGAEQPDHQVDRDGEQPDDGPRQAGDHVERGRGEQRDPHGALQREALRGQFAEHQREERDAHGHDSEGERSGRVVAQALVDHPVAEQPGQRVGAVGAGHQGREGSADLHRREEPVGVGGEPGRRRPAPAALRQRAHLALAQRDECHLRGSEETADGHDNEDDDHVQDDLAAQRPSPTSSVAHPLTAAPGNWSVPRCPRPVIVVSLEPIAYPSRRDGPSGAADAV